MELERGVDERVRLKPGSSCCLADTAPWLPGVSLLGLTLATPQLWQTVVLQSPGHTEPAPLVTCCPTLCCSLLCLTVRLCAPWAGLSRSPRCPQAPPVTLTERRNNRKETQRETLTHTTPAAKAAVAGRPQTWLWISVSNSSLVRCAGPQCPEGRGQPAGSRVSFPFVLTPRCTLKHLELYVALLNKIKFFVEQKYKLLLIWVL